ncbi:Late embryogenesis abundant protein, LEA_2 subgroup [Dillenia turbinata]|uniref:Late embryogenesis abundant protein, LEA_2 subgroup n=1 Tax=Dillenia turbinata TaxID=194707 RepID=A0AAN8Z1Q0_9MAGN
MQTMVEGEQVRPLAPALGRVSSDGGAASLHQKKLRRRRCIRCCGCIGAVYLIQVIVIIILIFTVFRVKDPVIKMNNVKVLHLDLINGTIPAPGSNMTLLADVSVKNPNYVSFKYGNTTTSVYYRGTLVGEARNGPGESKARRTSQMNVTVDIIVNQVLSNPNIKTDYESGTVSMTSYTRVGGKVKILFIKKHILVKMNCTITANVTSQQIDDLKCKKNVDL